MVEPDEEGALGVRTIYVDGVADIKDSDYSDGLEAGRAESAEKIAELN